MALEARHGDMDMAPKKWYEPLLKTPVLLHSSRDPGNCTLTPERCAYKTRYWVFWYVLFNIYGTFFCPIQPQSEDINGLARKPADAVHEHHDHS